MSTTPETARSGSRTPRLASLHRELGGVLRPLAPGGEVTAHYGDRDAEYRLLTAGGADRAAGACALLERSWGELLQMTGPDRGRFLGGLVTCAVKDLAPGDGRYGFVTSGKGKVLADLTVLATEDRFLLDLPPGRGAEVRDHVLKYRIADRVELEPLADVVVLTLAGTGAAAFLGEHGRPPEGAGGAAASRLPAAPWQHRELVVAGHPARVVLRGLSPVPAYDLRVQAGTAEALFRALLAAGASAVGFEAWEAARVEAGLPRFGPDFDEDHLPQETGLEEAAVDYEKGCYLGQEVVARIHYRGGVNKGLRGLDLGEAPPPAPGTRVLHDGRAAGTLGTALVSPRLGRTVALAILHRRVGEAGARVEVEGAGPATVRDLPFPGSEEG